MKKKYPIILIGLITFFLIFEALLFLSDLGANSQLEKAIQSAGVFVALLASILALAIADPERKSAKMKIEKYVDKTTEVKYDEKELSNELREKFKNSKYPIKSYRLIFKLANISGFTLREPDVTFRLPLDKQHPYNRNKDGVYSSLGFNSNLYNMKKGLRQLELADSIIISSKLFFWHNEEKFQIWIRMILGNEKLEKFDIWVSVDCANADGILEKVEVYTKDLLE